MGFRARDIRWLQIGVLVLLLVSAAQVFWWIFDQAQRTEGLSRRLSALYEADAVAARQLLDRGADPQAVERLFPHLGTTSRGEVVVRPRALEGLREDRLRWLNQYGWEGAFFLAVLVVSMAIVWKAVYQERLLRQRQQNFIASVSHEFKSPLASLRLSVETIGLRELPRERIVELAGRMGADLERMEDMIGKILETSQLERGRVRVHRETVVLSRAVERVLEELETRLELSGVEIEVEIAPELEIFADAAGVRTVARNLLDNALAAVSEAEGGSIRLSAVADRRWVRLIVEDNGAGFRPQEARRLFGKFYQPDDGSGRKRRGQGLGLFIVKRFVELERGRIQASSEGPGKGARFEVSWPASRGIRA